MQANAVLAKLFPGLELEGDTEGDKVLSPYNKEPLPAGTFLNTHPVVFGITASLYEGVTICYPKNLPSDFNVLARSTDNHEAIFCRDKKPGSSFGRTLVDVGFTKHFCSWNAAGNGRYIINANTWLIGEEIANDTYFV